MLFMPQDLLPRTASSGQAPQKLCMSVGPTVTAVWGPLGPHIPWDVPSLLRGRWRMAASSAPASSSEPASPGGTSLGRKGSGQALTQGPAPAPAGQPVLSRGCKDTPGSSTVHSRGLPAPHLKAEAAASASPTAPTLPCSSTCLCLCPHIEHPMAKGSCTAHTPLPAGQTHRCFSAKSVLGNTNQRCLRPPHAAAPQQAPGS